MRKFILPLLAAGSLAFAVMHVVRGAQHSADSPPPVEPPRSSFGNTVAGAGIVEPQTENISIGTPLPGLVQEVFVKVGQQVSKGDPLFRLDDRHLQSEKKMRQAALDSANARLKRLESLPRKEELPAALAKVREAEASVAFELDQFQRTDRLHQNRAIPEEEYIRRKQSYGMAREQLAKVKADFDLLKSGAWEPDVAIARAEVAQAQGMLEQTRTELNRLLVAASVDGEVLQVNVRPGEFVAASAGQALVMLGDVRLLHLRVDIGEHDLARFRFDAPAFASLRGDPSKKYTLEPVRVEPFVIPKKSLMGVSTERVDTRVLQVIYRIESTSDRLFVGQQMDAFVSADN